MKFPDAFKMVRIYIADRLAADRPFFIFQFDEQHAGFKVLIIIVLIVELQGNDLSVRVVAHKPFCTLLAEFKGRSMYKNELIFQQDIKPDARQVQPRSEEHTSELQSRFDLVCRLLLEKKNKTVTNKDQTRTTAD